MPEIIFLGRSNVGKSSLINNLTNSNIAKVSQVPGKTQLINFFNVDNKFYLVDLPGYGYAKVNKEKRDEWNREIILYIKNRPNIAAIFFLLDIRRVPSSDDKDVLALLKEREQKEDFAKILYVLTKADKLSKNELQKQKGIIATELFVNQMDMIPYSVLSKVGKDVVLRELNSSLL